MVAEQWAVNSAGECHVDIVEVASSILASPTKAYSIPDKELDKPFSFIQNSLKLAWTHKLTHRILKMQFCITHFSFLQVYSNGGKGGQTKENDAF